MELFIIEFLYTDALPSPGSAAGCRLLTLSAVCQFATERESLPKSRSQFPDSGLFRGFFSAHFLFTNRKMPGGDAPARFVTPEIKDNPNGWGPNTIPAHFKDMPYQPFSKSDRLGKVSPYKLSSSGVHAVRALLSWITINTGWNKKGFRSQWQIVVIRHKSENASFICDICVGNGNPLYSLGSEPIHALCILEYYL